MLTSLAFVVGQFVILFQSILRRNQGEPPRQEIASVNEIPVGSSQVFHYPNERTPSILVRLDESTFVAYEQQCTHLACPVIPQPETGHLHCPCHEGVFDLHTGQPLAGPPRRPLARVKLEVQAGKIYAAGVEEAFA
ncbi:MAG: Rieske (2Fe-2S) protein [Anaerolineae bacterium]|nr:Rieske (2Fe-2S) protein [Anaerolineae bacterium]